MALETHNAWPAGVLTRVPNWIYQSADIYAAEQENIFRGAAWTFLCLEIDIPRRGDYRTAALGDMPVIVVREDNRAIRAFENRCAHRGALLAFDDGGTVEDFTCVYHNWRYDLCGNLQSIAFRNGVQGKGGMPKDFAIGERGPRKLRVESVCGLVFGTLSQAAPPLEEFLGEEVVARIARVCRAPMEIIGRFKQTLPNNWKLFMENTRDSYHASLLHVFFTTFRLNRLSQRGGLMVSKTGAHSVSWSALDKAPSASAEYNAEQLRADKKDFLLADPSLIEGFDEFGDGITLQVISIFPGCAFAQVQNTIAVRRIVPKGLDQTEVFWTYLGFRDDTREQRRIRLKQSNLIGPAGLVSLEDGIIGNFVQRGIAGAAAFDTIVEMGGDAVESTDTRASEASIRGFWKIYRRLMGI
ncbi:MAG TPA: Rieske 2Fe-2S domain-containing protein [Stellaceae bacterium]|nr:Rieske 2Fe-2S domain-containing protein [Stellaceae bacterium]